MGFFSKAWRVLNDWCECYNELNSNDRTYIHEGPDPYSDIKANFDGKYLREGPNPYGKIIANFDGKYFRKGMNPYGDFISNIDQIK